MSRRLRLRTLMIAVAIAAVPLGLVLETIRLTRLASEYRLRAQTHAAKEANYRQALEVLLNPEIVSTLTGVRRSPDVGRLMSELVLRPGSKDLLVDWEPPQIEIDLPTRSDPRPVNREAAEAALIRRITHEHQLRRKYEKLADNPWLRLTPDPPSPR